MAASDETMPVANGASSIAGAERPKRTVVFEQPMRSLIGPHAARPATFVIAISAAKARVDTAPLSTSAAATAAQLSSAQSAAVAASQLKKQQGAAARRGGFKVPYMRQGSLRR